MKGATVEITINAEKAERFLDELRQVIERADRAAERLEAALGKLPPPDEEGLDVVKA